MDYHKGIYERFWQNLKYGFSLNAYKSMALDIPLPSLLEKMNETRKREKHVLGNEKQRNTVIENKER